MGYACSVKCLLMSFKIRYIYMFPWHQFAVFFSPFGKAFIQFSANTFSAETVIQTCTSITQFIALVQGFSHFIPSRCHDSFKIVGNCRTWSRAFLFTYGQSIGNMFIQITMYIVYVGPYLLLFQIPCKWNDEFCFLAFFIVFIQYKSKVIHFHFNWYT